MLFFKERNLDALRKPLTVFGAGACGGSAVMAPFVPWEVISVVGTFGAASVAFAGILWNQAHNDERRRSEQEREKSEAALARTNRMREIVAKELQKEKEIAQNYLDMAAIVMAGINKEGEVELLNRKGLSLLQLEEEEAIGEQFDDMFVPWKHKAAFRSSVGLDGSSPKAHFECIVSTADGDERLMLWRNSPIKDAEGEVQAFLLCGEDITERRMQEAQLELMRRMLEGVDEGVLAIGQDMKIVWANPSSGKVTGYATEQLKGMRVDMLYPTSGGIQKLKEAFDAIKESGSWKGEIMAKFASGLGYPQRLSLAAIKDFSGHITHAVAVFSNISKEKEDEERIVYLASHDPLTGLPNRAAFSRDLEDSLIRAKAANKKMALMFIDLDHFKKVNDTLGHAAGDALLIEVAERLRHTLRKGDLISRLGGDEFTVILECINGPSDAEMIANKILSSLSAPYVAVGGAGIAVTPSIGICMYPDDGEDSTSLLKSSDMAMYKAKSEGSAALRFFSAEIAMRDVQRLAMESAMRKALSEADSEESVRVVWQPIWNLASGELVAFETLSRWRHNGESVSPEVFITLAEETGLIEELGHKVLFESVNRLASWQSMGYSSLRVSVNLSGRQFRDRELLDKLKKVIDETGANPAGLQLELTETTVMENEDDATKLMHELKKLGVIIAIDDFGTGYSSLSRLKTLPIDCIKIDRSFVKDIPEDENSIAIARAVISMGLSMGIKIVAEGVETKEQVKFLAENGADEGQGFFLGKPEDVDVAERLVMRHARHFTRNDA